MTLPRIMLSRSRTLSLGLIGLGLSLVSGCAEPITSHNPDPSRRAAPVPACLMRLPPRNTDSGFMRQLQEEEYWKLVFPSAKPKSLELPEGSLACTGRPVFDDEAFQGAKAKTPGKFATGDILYGGGPNRIKVLWFRTHQLDDGRAAGPLAIVRTLEDYAEVYGVGAYAGDPERTRLGLERMGPDLIITATDDGCSGATPGSECDSLMHAYLPYRGALVKMAQIDLERVRYAEGLEPGVNGKVEYRLTTAASFEKTRILLAEKVDATGPEGQALRRAEFERVLKRENAHVRSDDMPLWDRMYAKRIDSAKSSATPSPGEADPYGSDEDDSAASPAPDDVPAPEIDEVD